MARPRATPRLVLATAVGEAGGGAASAAAVAVAAASDGDRDHPAPVVVAELGARSRRGPTMLASVAARELEGTLTDAGFRAAARGAVCWLALAGGDEGLADLERALERVGDTRLVVVLVPPSLWSRALERAALGVGGGLVRCQLPAARSLAALATIELRELGLLARIDRHGCGPLAARRALAGLDPGGGAGRRARRIARAFLGRGRVVGGHQQAQTLTEL